MRDGTAKGYSDRQEAAASRCVGVRGGRALIIAGGQLADGSWAGDNVRDGGWDTVVCVDGGSTHAARLGVRPDVIIGDLDSAEEEAVARFRLGGVTFVTHPAEKDKTDLDLAVEYVVARGSRDITAIGAIGDRLDHTLANVLLTIKAASLGATLILTDGTSTVRLIQGEATIAGGPGDWVSLLPVGGDARGVHTEGLKYELRGGELRIGETLGISNELTGSLGRVRVKEGLVILIHTRRS
ncbi:MAG: thiamine diphosphokinase [Bacteroidota bacterium]